MKFGNATSDFVRLEMNMTPMIDVCFQMIIFFVVNMRVFSPEGDFNITMPLAAPQEGLPGETEIPPIKIRLQADKNGNLAGIQMGQRSVGSFQELRRQIRQICGEDRGPTATNTNPEVVFDCDYNLKYEFVVNAVTAISGYMANNEQSIVRMIEKIRFAPPRE